MNGRIYDPLLGRFLSADIKIQNPLSLQSYNRYSYMMNNPLSGVDMDGFEASFINNALFGAWAGLANLAISTAQAVKFAATHADPVTAAAFKYVPALKEFSEGMDKAAEDMKQAASDGIVSVTGADNQTSHVFAQSAVLTEFGVGLFTGSAATRTEQTAVAAEKQVTQAAGKLSGETETLARSTTEAPKPGVASEVPKDAPTGGPGCFAEGTLVETPEGLVPIEELEVGDSVMAYDLATGAVVSQIILETPRNYTYYWVHVDVDGEEIKATRLHRFWVESEKAWIAAIDLKPGMVLRKDDGQMVTVTYTRLEALTEPETTFNLVVDVNHNYFVGATSTM